jgi:hypothetical protein
MPEKSKTEGVTANDLAALQAQLNALAARAGVPAKAIAKKPRRTVQTPSGDAVTHDAAITFRIPSKWKANIERQLLAMGLPKRRHSDFFRGALVASLGTAMRAKDPAWQAFLEAAQPIAQQTLGTKLKDEGLEAILRQGTILSGTSD